MKRYSLIATILLFGMSGCVTPPPQLGQPPEAQPPAKNKPVTAVQQNPKLKKAARPANVPHLKQDVKPPRL